MILNDIQDSEIGSNNYDLVRKMGICGDLSIREEILNLLLYSPEFFYYQNSYLHRHCIGTLFMISANIDKYNDLIDIFYDNLVQYSSLFKNETEKIKYFNNIFHGSSCMNDNFLMGQSFEHFDPNKCVLITKKISSKIDEIATLCGFVHNEP